jgi:CelD/BcsL family acetyltransferase involved in cellulose biosynthesis
MKPVCHARRVLSARLLVDEASVSELVEEWDGLAVAAGEPYCAPGWMLSWWRHAAPAGARLRVAVAHDAERLVGIAPFYGQRRFGALEWLRPLAAPVAHRVGPVCLPGMEPVVAAQLARALASAHPRPALLTFDGIPRDSPWPRLLAAAWPQRTLLHRRPQQNVAPVIGLGEPDYAAWLAGRSAHFRRQSRRRRRKLEAAGARFRRIDGDATVTAIEDLARLHRARWAWRGGSAALGEDVEEMLRGAAAALASRQRLWLWSIETEDALISAHLFVGAGDQAIYWLGGHDEAWNVYQPGLEAIVAAIEDGFARGIARLDLGPGAQAYKLRLTDATEILEFVSLAPWGAGFPLARGVLAARDGRRATYGALVRLRSVTGRWRRATLGYSGNACHTPT